MRHLQNLTLIRRGFSVLLCVAGLGIGSCALSDTVGSAASGWIDVNAGTVFLTTPKALCPSGDLAYESDFEVTCSNNPRLYGALAYACPPQYLPNEYPERTFEMTHLGPASGYGVANNGFVYVGLGWGGSTACYGKEEINYSIRIQGGDTSEPWNKKRDSNHVNSNLQMKAVVTDQNGQAKANVSVTVRTDVTTNTGGHNHNMNRPKGKLVATPAGTPMPVSTKDGTASITGTTDGSGIFRFFFGAEEVTGQHTLTAMCASCKSPANTNITVKVEGLQAIPHSPFYTFIGATNMHQENHYLTSEAASVIWRIAASYGIEDKFWHRREIRRGRSSSYTYMPPSPLPLNDASLVWGGLFDLKGSWASPHVGHRKGVVVDVRANSGPGAVPLLSFPSFQDMVSSYGAEAQVHCTSNKTDGQNRQPPTCLGNDGSEDSYRHFHIPLTGNDQ